MLEASWIALADLPCIIEQPDIPATMIAYCYGRRYADLICTIMPSKKGLKLGFNRGIDLPDLGKLLKAQEKISHHVEVKSEDEIHSSALKEMLSDACIIKG